MRTFIFAKKFFLKENTIGPGYLEITDGRFGMFYTEAPEKNSIIIDEAPNWIAPGLVDTHIHGYMNHEIMDNSEEGIQLISESLLSCGVTSFLPTTLTASEEQTRKVVQTIRNVASKVSGAKIQGIYLEGPFFTEKYKGAQNSDYFQDPNIKVVNRLQEVANGLIKKIAIAPERKGSKEFIKAMVSNGIVIALGHSDATYDQTIEAVNAGADSFVHAFNAMSGLNHREPGMLGALLSLDHCYAELIFDGHHVHPAVANILVKAIGHQQVVLITDCMKAGGMPEGVYNLGSYPVVLKNGSVRLQSGNLAGSVLELKKAIKNVVDWGIATHEEAIHMATYVPAKSCKIEDMCGSISIGRDADFIVLTPDMSVVATYLNGIQRYHI